MAKNSAEGNKERTARYRAGLAARGIRPVQLYAPEAAHALLRQAAGLMSREQNPLEPRQALRQASGANDPGEEHGNQNEGEQALAAAVAAVEAVRAELAEAREVKCQAEQRMLAQAEAALVRVEAAERGQEETAHKLAAVRAEAEAAQGRERTAQERADVLRSELAGIKGQGGWRGVLLRLARSGPQTKLSRASRPFDSG